MTADIDVDDLVGRLGCPVATCPDRRLQAAELRQKIISNDDDHDGWWDGFAEMSFALRDPMVVLRFAGGVNVVTFNGPETDISTSGDLMLHCLIAMYPIDLFSKPGGQGRHAVGSELCVGGVSYPAIVALAQVEARKAKRTGHRLLVNGRRPTEIIAYGAHLPDVARTVVLYGLPDQLDGIRLEWLSPRL